MPNKEIVDQIHGTFIKFIHHVKNKEWLVILLADEDNTWAIYLNSEYFNQVALFFALAANKIVLQKEDEIILTQSDQGFVTISVNGDPVPIDAERDKASFFSSACGIRNVPSSVSAVPVDFIYSPNISDGSFTSDGAPLELLGAVYVELAHTLEKFNIKSMEAPELEELMIGAILIDCEVATKVLSLVTPDCFMNPQYREYFETAYDIWKAGGTPSFEDLSKSSADDAVDLTRFAQSATGVKSRIDLYILLVLQHRIRRRVFVEAALLLIAAMDKESELDELIDRCKNLLLKVRCYEV